MIYWILIAGQPKKKLSQWLWRKRRRPSWRAASASPGCPGPSWPASTWRRSWKGRPRKCFVFLCFHLREAEQREKFRRKREAMKARQKKKKVRYISVKKTYFCCFTVSTFLICVSCDIGWAANGNNSAGTWPWRGLWDSEKRIEREGIVGVFGGWGDCHLHQEPLGSLDLRGFWEIWGFKRPIIDQPL